MSLFEWLKKKPHPARPSEEARREAKNRRNGWVYQIEGHYSPDDAVPPEAIQGAWKVDAQGEIEGDFIPNPNYRPQGHAGGGGK